MPVACDEDDDPTEEDLQLLLEKAIRESLREFAKSAFEPQHGASASQSIDSLVRDVSARCLKESGLHFPQSVKHTASIKVFVPPEPMLEDLEAMPWVLWREQSTNRSRAMVRTHSQVFGMRARHPEPVRQVSKTSLTSVDSDGIGSLSPSMHPGDTLVVQDMTDLPLDGEEPLGGGFEMGFGLCRQRSTFEDKAQEAVELEEACRKGVMSKRSTLKFGNVAKDGPKVVRGGLKLSNNSSHLLMHWQNRPRNVLIVAKPRDQIVQSTVQDMVAWLSSQGIVPILEESLLRDQPQMRNLPGARTFASTDLLEKRVDLVITVGGDGTLTWAVSLFRRAGMPPALSFAAGSLGFLTPFSLDGWVRTLTHILDLHDVKAPLPVVCRMRLMVKLKRRHHEQQMRRANSFSRIRTASSDLLSPVRKESSLSGGLSETRAGSEPLPVTPEVECFQCLNEILVHRGSSGTLAKLDVSVDGDKVTLVQGDGIILATPTGSTAYSLAAGGSMVHPGVPGILLTPVSPHSLSFRPAVLPDSARITISVPLTARHGAALSVDGKDIAILNLGDSIEVCMSRYPVPTICKQTDTLDWFASVQDGLQWNGRMEQK